MKIAMICSGFLPVVDGVTIAVFNRLQRLSELGHSVLVLCPDYRAVAEVYPNWQTYMGEILPGVQVVTLDSTPFMGMKFERNASVSSYATVLEQLERFQPDIIHVDEPDRLFLGFSKIPGVDYAKQHHIPCVGFFHTIFLLLMDDFIPLPSSLIWVLKQFAKRWITCRVFNAYDATLVASQFTYQTALKFGLKQVINGDFLGVDTEMFHPRFKTPNFFQEHYNLPDIDTSVTLLFVGRLTPEKGWTFTLKAFTWLARTYNLQNVSLVIVGDGPMRDLIQQNLERAGLKVFCLGRVRHDQMPTLFANSDIHITTCEKETRGLTILEAAAAGIPAIAPRSGGVCDSIQDGWNGVLFNPGDRQDFAAKLLHLVNDPALRQCLGQNGRDRVVRSSWEHAVQCLLEVWQAQIELKSH
jgi:glycosyltransferase involved in cell wall biosynthesis